MSTIVRFVKPEHEEILRDYLSDDGVSLIFGQEAQKHFADHDIEDGDEVEDYDFGGDADILVERVSTKEHHLAMHVAGDEE